MNKIFKLTCGLMVLAATLHVAKSAETQQFRITTLSSRPDMVSGGDVLVQIDVPPNAALDKAVIKLNGQDVTGALHPDATGHAMVGLVTGLKLGDNMLEVFSDQKARSAAAKATLKNHPITGPVFAGAQEEPFVCQTQDFKLPDGTTLGPPLDANCSAKTVVTYVYKSTAPAPARVPGGNASDPALKPLPSMTALPPDVAYTTTTTGEKVPYVVRVETGTIDRGIYQIAVLDDPTNDPPAGTPPKAWNKRLLYSFGGGCTGGYNKQGTSIGFGGTFVTDAVEGKGYAQASSTLNVFGNNCNSVLAAEVMMMVKEHFIKEYGKPDFTLSRGGSGGSEQQIPIADNYPGLIDGIIPSLTFTDALTNTQEYDDSELLFLYYKTPTGAALSEKQKLAVEGSGRVKDFGPQVDRIRATAACPKEIPAAQLYDPQTNPKGVRCNIYDHTAAVFGRDPATGRVPRDVDNVGVQYGLAALNDGTINVDQFLDVNQKIGGYDRDGNVVPQRSVADPPALRAAYRMGQITDGGLGLKEVPIIEVRPYRDLLPMGDDHLKFHSFSFRGRLQKENGTSANHVILLGPVSRTGQMGDYAVEEMDQWLTALGKDTSKDRMLDKIVRTKPKDLADSCWTDSGERIVEPIMPASGKCNDLYHTYESVRMVAGEGPLNDIFKCQLRPVDFKDYKAALTDSQKAAIKAAFPSGVCDWSKPGIEQQHTTGTWLAYK